MADFSRITTQDHALQKVQDATARALRSTKEDIDAVAATADAAVTPAGLAAHAALTSGVHGLPSGSTGRILATYRKEKTDNQSLAADAWRTLTDLTQAITLTASSLVRVHAQVNLETSWAAIIHFGWSTDDGSSWTTLGTDRSIDTNLGNPLIMTATDQATLAAGSYTLKFGVYIHTRDGDTDDCRSHVVIDVIEPP